MENTRLYIDNFVVVRERLKNVLSPEEMKNFLSTLKFAIVNGIIFYLDLEGGKNAGEKSER